MSWISIADMFLCVLLSERSAFTVAEKTFLRGVPEALFSQVQPPSTAVDDSHLGVMSGQENSQ